MSRRLHTVTVSGLTRNVQRSHLRELFHCVAVEMATDRVTGLPFNYAWVGLPTLREAEAAIEKWDGGELDGSILHVTMFGQQSHRHSRSRSHSHPHSSSSSSGSHGHRSKRHR